MGAGEQLAGEGLAGEEATMRAASAPARRPAAIHFDALTRDFPLADDGRYVGIHPVDARVEMALHVEFGKVGATPGTGSSVRQIRYVDPDRLRAEVSDRVRRALRRLTDAGDITIESIDAEPRTTGGANVLVDYFNERLPDRPRKTAKG